VTTRVEVPDEGVRGVIIQQGSILGGWVLYVTEDGRLRYVHNRSGREAQSITAPDPLPPGSHDITFAFGMPEEEPTLAELFVNGTIVGTVEIPSFTWHRFSISGAGLCCGWTVEPPVADDIVAPARFTGVLHPVVIEVEGRPMVDAIAEAVDAVVSQ
jgi:arylsulfatase